MVDVEDVKLRYRWGRMVAAQRVVFQARRRMEGCAQSLDGCVNNCLSDSTDPQNSKPECCLEEVMQWQRSRNLGTVPESAGQLKERGGERVLVGACRLTWSDCFRVPLPGIAQPQGGALLGDLRWCG